MGSPRPWIVKNRWFEARESPINWAQRAKVSFRVQAFPPAVDAAKAEPRKDASIAWTLQS